MRIKLKYADLTTFMEKYALNVSRGGVFIPTRTPRDVGTLVRFEFLLATGAPVLRGEGQVIWIKPFDAEQPRRAHGMGLRFTRLDAESRVLLDQILTWKREHQEEAGEAQKDDAVFEVTTGVSEPNAMGRSPSGRPTNPPRTADSGQRSAAPSVDAVPTPIEDPPAAALTPMPPLRVATMPEPQAVPAPVVPAVSPDLRASGERPTLPGLEIIAGLDSAPSAAPEEAPVHAATTTEPALSVLTSPATPVLAGMVAGEPAQGTPEPTGTKAPNGVSASAQRSEDLLTASALDSNDEPAPTATPEQREAVAELWQTSQSQVIRAARTIARMTVAHHYYPEDAELEDLLRPLRVPLPQSGDEAERLLADLLARGRWA